MTATTKQKGKRSRFAQNRIDYIVYGNLDGARGMLFDQGYEPPKNPHKLVGAVKELIQKRGEKAVKDLIRLHPDKAAIQALDRVKEDSYCGACGSYSYNSYDNFCGVCGHSHYDGQGEGSFYAELTKMTRPELEEYYQRVLSKSNANPDDENLAKEVEMVWDELRLRKEEDTDTTPKEKDKPVIGGIWQMKEGLMILGLVFVAGVLVGSSVRLRPASDG